MKEYLFSYGTLQKDKTQLDLFGRLLQGSTDVLKSYKILPIEIRDEAFLAKGEDKFQKIAMATHNILDSLEGTVFEVTADELLLADKYEPGDYVRIKVKLESGKEAWIYAGKPQ